MMKTGGWKKLYFNAQNIVLVAGRATLIKMPAGSRYKGYTFWYPSKLIADEGGKGYYKSILYTEESIFKITKRGNKNEVEHLDVEEMQSAFEKVHANLAARCEAEQSYLNVQEPQAVKRKVEVKESLKR